MQGAEASSGSKIARGHKAAADGADLNHRCVGFYQHPQSTTPLTELSSCANLQLCK